MARDLSAEASPSGPRPAAFSQHQWPTIAVLLVCAELVTLALVVGPYPHEHGQRILLAWSALGAWRMMTRDA